MKTREQLLDCIEDDMELMGEQRVVYLKKEGDQVVDYDYLPSEDYREPVVLQELQADLMMRGAEKSGCAGERKLAVIFPGIGYSCEMPILYYSERLAKQHGYDIIRVNYSGFPKDVKGNWEKMKEAFNIAMEQTKELLKDVDWNTFGDILFISKSVGTVVSSYFAKEQGLHVKNALFTPLKETFEFAEMPCVAFHGTADSWAKTEDIQRLAQSMQIPVYLAEGAEHSLETGDALYDMEVLKTMLGKVENFIK